MRFEVKAGGVAAILFAMTLLSGAVFALGLLAGYDVGRQAQIDSAQLATSYPLQPQPPSAAPASQTSAQPNETVQSDSSPPSSAAGSNKPTERPATLAGESNGRSITPSATSERQRLVSASAPPTNHGASTTDSASADENATAPDSGNSEALDQPARTASNTDIQGEHRAAAKAPAVHHRGYNIQIEAAMDISGADRMMARLQKLGFSSHLVPTEIDGQRWYKVEVGPYATAEAASDAEAQMRQKYDQTYGGIPHGNSGRASADDDSDE
jgi:cell division protein FtsN